jgi:mono/diheme cytochrome c family protein
MLSNPVPPLGDPDLARLVAPADWYLMVTNGNMQNFMPPFSSLSVPERWDVVAYATMLSIDPAEIARGQERYTENCVACHGLRGEGDGPDAGGLSASPVDFTDQEFMGTRSAADLFRSITDGLGEMHAYTNLSEEDRWALTSFLRTLTFAEATLETTSADDSTETPPDEALPELTATPVETTVESVETPADAEIHTQMGSVTIEMVSVSGGSLPTGIDVNLFGFEDMSQVYTRTVTLPAGGIAVIEDVPLEPGQFIIATAEHEGVVYGSDITAVEPDMRSMTLTIPYYESTTDLSILQAERLHVFFEFLDEDSVRVFVLYIFSNNSDKVLTTENENEPMLVFKMPDGAENLQRDTGMEFQDIDLPDGFGLLTVYPAVEQYQILYSFEMPYERDSVDFDLPIGLDTSAVIVMIPEGDVEIQSDQLVEAGLRDIEGVSYNMYNGSNLQVGEFLGMEVSGKPNFPTALGVPGTDANTTQGLVIGLAAVGLVLIGAGVYFWVGTRGKDEERDNVDETAADLPLSSDPDDLIDAIITLDDLYQAGEIPETAYQERRAVLKDRLKELLER